MAVATGKARCVTCGKEKSTVRCDGCSQPFCFNHLGDHRQELDKQLDELDVARDLFRQTLTEQTAEPQAHSLIKQIDKWERDSINKIRQTAEEARQLLLEHIAGHVTKIEGELNQLTTQLQESRQENDFFETDLKQWKDELTRLMEELTNPSNITIQQDSKPLVTKIRVNVSALSHMPYISINAKWTQNGSTVAGGNGKGNGVNQLNYPTDLYVADDQTLYIADYSNHRIVEWKSDTTSGQVVLGGNGPGNRNDQLSGPGGVIVDKESDSLIISDYKNKRIVRWPCQNGTKGETLISNVGCWGLAIDNDGFLYVSDYDKHEVRRWKIGETSGTVVAGGNRAGNRLDQLNHPTYIFVDQDHSVYVSDGDNHRVMKWMKGTKEGIVVAGGQSQGSSLTQLSYPRGVIVDQLGTVYVSDYSNHRVMRWHKGAMQGSIVVAGNEKGGGANQLNASYGFSFDKQNNIYVVDYNNHRVQKFNIDPGSNT